MTHFFQKRDWAPAIVVAEQLVREQPDVARLRKALTATQSNTRRFDQRMLGLTLWPLIRSHCLVHDKYYRLAGVETLPLHDPQSHFSVGHQNTNAVLEEADRLGIPRLS